MTESEFERIKNKIKEKELQNAQAKGKQESIIEMWKNKYGCNTLEEATKKLDELKNEKQEKEMKRDEYFNKLVSITNWENL